jgi:hypothetical protein
MSGDLHLAPLPHHFALRIEEKGTALDAQIRLAVVVFFLDDIKGAAEDFLRVADQLEGKLLFDAEFLVRSEAVARDADNLRTERGEIGVQRGEILPFRGAAGGSVFRVKIKHRPLPAQTVGGKGRGSGAHQAEILRQIHVYQLRSHRAGA